MAFSYSISSDEFLNEDLLDDSLLDDLDNNNHNNYQDPFLLETFELPLLEEDFAQEIDFFGDQFDAAASSAVESSSEDEDEEPTVVHQTEAYKTLSALIPSIEDENSQSSTSSSTVVTRKRARTTTTTTAESKPSLVMPEKDECDLYLHLSKMETDQYHVPTCCNLRAREARRFRKQRLMEKRRRLANNQSQSRPTFYMERRERAQTRKRVGGRFQSEGKLPFIPVTELS